MTADPHVVVLLPSSRDLPTDRDALAGALAGRTIVLTPRLPGLSGGADEPFRLDRAAESVARAVTEAGAERAQLLGVGVGAMVALTLAATAPEHVAGLALVPRQVAVSPLLRSLPTAVIGLLPSARLQRLGLPADQVLGLLDQVRAVDSVPLAGRVATPATVLLGARDRVNARASRTLARAGWLLSV